MKKINKLLSLLVILTIIGASIVMPTPRVVAAEGFKVQFFNQNVNATINSICANFRIINTGTSALNLSTVKSRYYFTVDTEQPLKFFVDYTNKSSAGIKGNFYTVSNVTNADRYLEISFDSGSLEPNGQLIVQSRIAKENWSNFDQSNDYSFNSAAGYYVDWSKVTGYSSGSLVWGTEPNGGDTEAPSVPANLNANNKTLTSISLDWASATDNIGVASYEVYRNDTFIASTANLNYTDLDVTSGSSYTYTIFAKDVAGNLSQKSNAVSAQACNDKTVSMGNAVITSSTATYYPAAGCFDGNPATIMRSEGVNPAFVQAAFTTPQKISMIRVLLGQIGYATLEKDNWKVEAADTQADMDNKSGTYQLVVAERKDVGGSWDGVVLQAPCSKKIWKFTVTRTIGDAYVHIPELELWSVQQGEAKKLDINSMRRNLSTVVSCSDINESNDLWGIHDNDFIESSFDGIQNNQSSTKVINPAYIQLDFTKPKSIPKVNIGASSGHTVKIEVADTLNDFENKNASYSVVFPETEVPNNQPFDHILQTPVTKRFWKITVKNTKDSYATFPEVAFYSTDNTAPEFTAPELSAEAADARTIKLKWNSASDNDEVMAYKVLRSVDNVNFDFVDYAPFAIYTDTLLDPVTKYYYKVVACDPALNQSTESNTVSAVTTNSAEFKEDFKGLVICYDPYLPHGTYKYYDSTGNEKTIEISTNPSTGKDYKCSEYFGTKTPEQMEADMNSYNSKVSSATGKSINFTTDFLVINDYAPLSDCSYNLPQLLIEEKYGKKSDFNYNLFNHCGVNYHAICRDTKVNGKNLIQLIEEGDYDDFFFMNTYVNLGSYESRMGGHDSFWVNSPALNVSCSKKFVFFAGDSFECMGHMLESVFGNITKSWPKTRKIEETNYSKGSSTNPQETKEFLNGGKYLSSKYVNDWTYYTTHDIQSPGNAQCGWMHYPPNGSEDYSWKYKNLDFDHGGYNFYAYGDAVGAVSFQENMYDPCYELTVSADKSGLSMMSEPYYEIDQYIMGSDLTYEAYVKVEDTYLQDGISTDDIDYINNTLKASSNAGIIFRVTNFENGPDSIGTSGFNAYYAGINPVTNQVILGKFDGGVYSPLAVKKISDLELTGFHKLKVIADDSKVLVYLNNISTPVINEEVDASNHFENIGGVGILSNSTDADFDNISINFKAKTYADNWYNYPNLNGNARIIDSDEWSGDQNLFQIWWYSHIPKAAGIAEMTDLIDGSKLKVLSNWWGYAFNFNLFDGKNINFEVTGFPNATQPPIINALTSSADSYVLLSWQNEPDSTISTVDIYRKDGGTDSTSVFEKIGSVDPSTTQFNDLTADTGNVYTYRIITKDSLGAQLVPVDVTTTGIAEK